MSESDDGRGAMPSATEVLVHHPDAHLGGKDTADRPRRRSQRPRPVTGDSGGSPRDNEQTPPHPRQPHAANTLSSSATSLPSASPSSASSGNFPPTAPGSSDASASMTPTPRMTARTQVNAPFHTKTISERSCPVGRQPQRSQKLPNAQVKSYDFREPLFPVSKTGLRSGSSRPGRGVPRARNSSRSPRPGSVAASLARSDADQPHPTLPGLQDRAP